MNIQNCRLAISKRVPAPATLPSFMTRMRSNSALSSPCHATQTLTPPCERQKITEIIVPWGQGCSRLIQMRIPFQRLRHPRSPTRAVRLIIQKASGDFWMQSGPRAAPRLLVRTLFCFGAKAMSRLLSPQTAGPPVLEKKTHMGRIRTPVFYRKGRGPKPQLFLLARIRPLKCWMRVDLPTSVTDKPQYFSPLPEARLIKRGSTPRSSVSV